MKINQSRVGFWQEVLANGTIANSFMRLLETFFFILLCMYTYFSFTTYNTQLAMYVELLRTNCLTEQTFVALTMQLTKINWDVFGILVVATVVPKAIQKFAEAKTGIKDTTESTVTTTTIDKTQTTVPQVPTIPSN